MLALGVASIWFPGAGETENAVLTIAGRDGAYGEAMELAVADYKAAHPNVDFEFLGHSGSAFFEQTVVDLGSKAGSYDIPLIDGPTAPQYMSAG